MSGAAAGPVQAVYFTDPLCCWSWAMEPAWRRLRYEFGGGLTWRYHMGGMIPDWDTFRDPLNAIGRPAQVAPHWVYVRAVTGVPIDEAIWRDDPPSSSYPACVAVKAAQRQGAAPAERYLRGLREAVMLRRRNVARREVLLEVAGDLAASGALDAGRFAADLDSEETLADFRDDLKEARYQGIGRFPTLVLLRPGARGLILVGYRPYAVLRSALAHLAPDLQPQRQAIDPAEYAAYWGGVTQRELAEVTPEGG